MFLVKGVAEFVWSSSLPAITLFVAAETSPSSISSIFAASCKFVGGGPRDRKASVFWTPKVLHWISIAHPSAMSSADSLDLFEPKNNLPFVVITVISLNFVDIRAKKSVSGCARKVGVLVENLRALLPLPTPPTLENFTTKRLTIIIILSSTDVCGMQTNLKAPQAVAVTLCHILTHPSRGNQ